jgi:pyruvate,orthophosphate dikinase
MTRTSIPRDAGQLELSLLQLLRLKGRVKPDDLPASLRQPEEVCTELLASAVADGFGVQKGSSARLTPEGRQRLTALLDAERARVDQQRLAGLYDEFDRHNTDFKAIITAWQMRDGHPNDHADADYDADVLAKLDTLHAEFTPLLERIVTEAPRLAHYPPRFEAAMDRIHAGEHHYVARPIIDSYHTVWFELHEELIGLCGRTREEEAAAGRAV